MGAPGTTPGKWAVSPFQAWVVCDQFDKDGDLLPVAALLWPTDERTEAETYANAHQIAASGELYDALEALVRQQFDYAGSVEGSMHFWDAARAALARARGEA